MGISLTGLKPTSFIGRAHWFWTSKWGLLESIITVALPEQFEDEWENSDRKYLGPDGVKCIARRFADFVDSPTFDEELKKVDELEISLNQKQLMLFFFPLCPDRSEFHAFILFLENCGGFEIS